MKLTFVVAAALLVCRVESQWPFPNFGPPSQPAITTNLPPLPNVAFSGLDSFATSFANLFGTTFANNLFNMLLGRGLPIGQQGPLLPNAIPSNIPSAPSAASLLPTAVSAGGQNPFSIPPFLNGLAPTNSYGFPASAPSGPGAPALSGQSDPATNSQTAPATSTPVAPASNGQLTSAAIGLSTPAINRPALNKPLVPASIGQLGTSPIIQGNNKTGGAIQSATFLNLTDDALVQMGDNDDA